MSDVSCRACSGEWPRADHFIVDLELTNAYLHEDQFFPGWTVLVLKHHATELFHLTAVQRATLIEEMSKVANALSKVFQARKINYELLGNQLPHIHWHLIPRVECDPAPLEPIWRVPHAPLRLEPSELQSRIRLLLRELRRNSVPPI
jgi:diadenosine tetraphosphate (Ap4A) HIT family hydrolase